MHNVVFAPRGVHVLVLASSAWFTVMDTLLAQRRFRLSYVFGDPVDPVESGRRGKYPWTLPPATAAEALDQFLAA